MPDMSEEQERERPDLQRLVEIAPPPAPSLPYPLVSWLALSMGIELGTSIHAISRAL